MLCKHKNKYLASGATKKCKDCYTNVDESLWEFVEQLEKRIELLEKKVNVLDNRTIGLVKLG